MIKVLIVWILIFDVVVIGGLVVVEIIGVVVDFVLLLWVEDKVEESDCLELILVKVVVFGGCGVGFEEDFVLIEGLVDKLGVVVGVLCVVVDLGFVLNDW